jgi:SAM-dependent methyltransferase
MFRRWRGRQSAQPGGGTALRFGQSELRSIADRQYLAEVPYELPKDPEEVNRLDFQHYMLRYMLRGNFAAPIGSPLSILDVGCGTGRWGMEMAFIFPNANIVGVDMVNQASIREENLPNYTFVQGNLLEGLPFANNTFEYVHQRLLVLGIPVDKWPNAIRELKRVVVPRGWVELAEASYGIGAPAIERLFYWMGALGKLRNIDVGAVASLDKLMRHNGLRNVHSHKLYIPVGEHGGRLGRWCATDVLAIFKGIRGPIIGAQIASERDFDATLTAFQNELLTQRSVIPFYIAYGQKPG